MHAGQLRVTDGEESESDMSVGESAGKKGFAGLCGDKAAGTCASRRRRALETGQLAVRENRGPLRRWPTERGTQRATVWSGARLPRGGVLVAFRGLAAHGGAQEPAQAASGLLIK